MSDLEQEFAQLFRLNPEVGAQQLGLFLESVLPEELQFLLVLRCEDPKLEVVTTTAKDNKEALDLAEWAAGAVMEANKYAFIRDGEDRLRVEKLR